MHFPRLARAISESNETIFCNNVTAIHYRCHTTSNIAIVLATCLIKAKISKRFFALANPTILIFQYFFVQGPFRTPDDVWQQRHKPLNPSLKVATSYFSAEDARWVTFFKGTCMHFNPLSPNIKMHFLLTVLIYFLWY